MPDGSKERRSGSRVVEAIDATNDLMATASRWTPQQTIQIACILLLTFLVAGFGALLWMVQVQARVHDEQIRDELAAQKRDCHAHEELTRVLFINEKEKDRAFMREENEKLRNAMVQAIHEASRKNP